MSGPGYAAVRGRGARRSRGLRCRTAVAQPVVQPTRPGRPRTPRSPAPPGSRPSRAAPAPSPGNRAVRGGQRRVQLGSRAHHRRLRAGPRPELGLARPRSRSTPRPRRRPSRTASPVTRTWRATSCHGKTSAARGSAARSAALAEPRLVKNRSPSSPYPLSSTVRAWGRRPATDRGEDHRVGLGHAGGRRRRANQRAKARPGRVRGRPGRRRPARTRGAWPPGPAPAQASAEAARVSPCHAAGPPRGDSGGVLGSECSRIVSNESDGGATVPWTTPDRRPADTCAAQRGAPIHDERQRPRLQARPRGRHRLRDRDRRAGQGGRLAALPRRRHRGPRRQGVVRQRVGPARRQRGQPRPAAGRAVPAARALRRRPRRRAERARDARAGLGLPAAARHRRGRGPRQPGPRLGDGAVVRGAVRPRHRAGRWCRSPRSTRRRPSSSAS